MAFLDEYGNLSLETQKEGATQLYIPVAVLVNDECRNEGEGKLREIQKNEFSGGQIKSRNVAGNHLRRLRILKTLVNVDFCFVAEVNDKSRIPRDSGLKYKAVAYKFLNRQLYERLCDGIRNVEIYPDPHGAKEFMESFRAYMDKNYSKPSLFHELPKYHDVPSAAAEPFVQVADFIAGSLARVFTPELRCNESDAFYELLRPKCVGMNGWPPQRRFVPVADGNPLAEEDEEVWRCALDRALLFIERNENENDTNVKMQVASLKRLLFESQLGTPDNFVVSDELIRHLQRIGFDDIKERRQLSEKVIGKLRDADVLIASRGSSDGGYRLPTTVSDLLNYLDHDTKLIIPMLDRLKRAKNVLALHTSGRVNFLDRQPGLAKIVEFYEKLTVSGSSPGSGTVAVNSLNPQKSTGIER